MRVQSMFLINRNSMGYAMLQQNIFKMSVKELISNQIFRTLTCNFTIRRKENPLKFGPLCYEHTVYKNLLVSSLPIFEKCFSQTYRSLGISVL